MSDETHHNNFWTHDTENSRNMTQNLRKKTENSRHVAQESVTILLFHGTVVSTFTQHRYASVYAMTHFILFSPKFKILNFFLTFPF